LLVQIDPRDVISKSPMSAMQVLIIAITVGLNGVDGFDVLSISYASPGIRAQWGIDQGVLGLVLVAELIGMAIGSIVLGGVADKVGRRPLMLACPSRWRRHVHGHDGLESLGAVCVARAHGLGDRRHARRDQRGRRRVLERQEQAHVRL
jgi:hypothetical protein